MTSVKLVGVRGKQTSFIPDIGPNTDAVPQAEEQTAVAAGPSPAELLGRLAPDDIKVLMKNLYAKELKAEFEAAYTEGRNQATEETQARLEAEHQTKVNELDLLIGEWKKTVESAVDNASIDLEDRNAIAVLVFDAVCKLLSHAVLDKQTSLALVHSILEQKAVQSAKHILVSETQFKQLEAAKVLSVADTDIKPDAGIAPGSYKVALTNGEIEHDLHHALQQFQQSLKLNHE